MSDKTKCKRCGDLAETYDFDADSSFWGFIVTDTKTTVERRVRIASTYFRRNPKGMSSVLKADEKQELCGDCWGLLVGRFLQGRSIAAMPGKEKW